MSKIYYIRDGEVCPVESTRDRLMATTQNLFFGTRKAALVFLKDKLTDEINERVRHIIDIEREIAAEQG